VSSRQALPPGASVPLPALLFRAYLAAPRSRRPSLGTEIGLCQVVFPAFSLGEAASASANASENASAAAAPPMAQAEACARDGHLLLRRAFDGSRVLQRAWQQQRDKPATAGRRLTLQLLNGQQQPALQWVFEGCRPSRLHHSPLDSLKPALLIETLELSFDSVELR
jgi:hypothetical protein